MPPLSVATRPRDTTNLEPIEEPVRAGTFGINASPSYPPPSKFLESPLPALYWTQTDSLRNFFTPGIPQERTSQLPTTGAATINAQSTAAAKKVVSIQPQTPIVTVPNPLSPGGPPNAGNPPTSNPSNPTGGPTPILPGGNGPPKFFSIDANKIGQFKNSSTVGSVLDTSGNNISMRGSVPKATGPGFTFTSTTTSIQWFWNQLTPFRTDGSIGQPQTGNINSTGLRTGITYFFYPFWDELTQKVRFVDNTIVSAPYITGVILNGTTGEITTTTQFTTPTTFSVECWAKTTSGADQALVSHETPQTGAPASNAFTFGYAGAALRMTLSTGNTTSTALYNDGLWHHFVATVVQSASVLLYADGVQVASGSAGAYTTANDWLRIGHSSISNLFTGTISHVSFYNGVALTANQVAIHYAPLLNLNMTQYENAVMGDSPTYFWKLTETSGTTAADSADSNTGTYTGGFTLNQSSATFLPEGSAHIAWPIQAAIILQAQLASSRLVLAGGSMSAATPSSGSGGGGGGGGSGGGGGGGRGFY